MKRMVLVSLTLCSSLGMALDCANLPLPAATIKIGQVSPKNVRGMLKSDDYSLVPGLLALANQDTQLTRSALELGLDLQQSGNEAMVYSVDAMVYLRGTSANQKAAMRIYDDAKNVADYYTRIQMLTSVRLLATLRIFAWDELADRLQTYLSQRNPQPQVLLGLRQLIRNTGLFNKAADQELLCQRIMNLN